MARVTRRCPLKIPNRCVKYVGPLPRLLTVLVSNPVLDFQLL